MRIQNPDVLASAAGVQLKLTDEEVKYIDEPYQTRAITGHA